MSSAERGVAIFYEPDGYKVAGRKVMGRHAAGEAFLRAAVAANGGGELWSYTANRNSAEQFAAQVREIDKSVTPRWCPKHRLDVMQGIGTLFYPGPDIAPLAGLRLRQGPASFSLCGVTHTTASHRAMDSISGALHSPLMPWDAIICTSSAVLETVRVQRAEEENYLRWRFGAAIKIPEGPQFPVIPLGVHVADYARKDGERAKARRALGIAEDEVVLLFVGRLSFHAKAHPDVMYRAAEAACLATGKKVTLVQCGWFENDMIEGSFKTGASKSAPHVKAMFTDGRKAEQRRQSWAAADIFISLADNIQETFGLTPLEGMAAGLPVVVTDWNGYKDTVRDGLDGFRIPTTMPPPGSGNSLASRYESDFINYDRYCGYSASLVSVDHGLLVERLVSLIDDPALRRTLGDNAKRRATESYDWAVVYKAYGELFAELGSIRAAAAKNGPSAQPDTQAPRHSPGRSDPMKSFAHYSTAHILPHTRVSAASRSDGLEYADLLQHPLFSFAKPICPDPAMVEAIRKEAQQPTRIDMLAQHLRTGVTDLTLTIAILAKMGLITLAV